MNDRANKTYAGERGDVLSFINWCAKTKLIPRGHFACEEVDKVTLSPGQRDTCSPDELAKLIAAANDSRDEVCISLGAHAGLRHAEILRFRLIFADMKNRVISLPPFYLHTKVTKVPIARMVPIQPVLYARLEKLIAEGFPNTALVVRRKNWANRLKRLKTRAGVVLPTNAFRHGYASHRRQLTQDPIRTSEEMGTSVKYLKNNYALPQLEDVSKAWFEA